MDNIDSYYSFYFRSKDSILAAEGCSMSITCPASDMDYSSAALENEVQKAFTEARRKGEKNPIVVGAIPFDKRSPSHLFIPERYQRVPAGKHGLRMRPVQTMCQPVPIHVGSDKQRFMTSVNTAQRHITDSNLRKVVLASSRFITFDAQVDAGLLFDTLQSQNASGYPFLLSLPDQGNLIGVSPELLIRRTGTWVESNPLAGTAKRSADPSHDSTIATSLLTSNKDLQEHRFVVDSIRNALGRHCSSLDVPPAPSLLQTRRLWHLSSTIQGTLISPPMTALGLACLLHPTPAVCGTPTDYAFEFIRESEPFQRGLFTGFLGWMDSNGNGEWVITLRCGIARGTTLQVFAGAGIIQESHPEQEWHEVQNKQRTMLEACGFQI